MSSVSVNENTTVEVVTKKINKKSAGLADRINKTQKAKSEIANCIEFRVN